VTGIGASGGDIFSDKKPGGGLVISAVRSGAGKTTVTLGLLRALAQDGVAVRPFKCGPDYIDPAFHAAAAGSASLNLDSWAMPGAMLDGLATGDGLAIAEGAMGLFDGVALPGAAGNGASADIAARMGWPVVLVLDVSGQAQSAAAVALGFGTFRADCRVAGVILNRVASGRHEALVREGMALAGVPVFGALPKDAGVALPERHLGLVQAEETAGLGAALDRLASFVRAHVDLAAVQAVAAGGVSGPMARVVPPGQRIALARDAAFSFIYPHLLQGWRAAGAEILAFSPLADEAPDGAADVVWLPGGYPELHAGRIAAAGQFLAGLRGFGGPVHGECGGYMVLGQALVAADGVAHPMAGLLGLVTSYQARKMQLGYRKATLLADMPGFAAGSLLRGHEFHYSSILQQPDAPLAEVRDASGTVVAVTGSKREMVSGSYFHLIAGAE